jgi:hypothetical protein
MSSGARVVFACTGIGEDDLRVWTWRGAGRAEVDDLSRWVAHRRVRGLGGESRGLDGRWRRLLEGCVGGDDQGSEGGTGFKIGRF